MSTIPMSTKPAPVTQTISECTIFLSVQDNLCMDRKDSDGLWAVWCLKDFELYWIEMPP